jgi:methanol metabolism-related c-type cytochrome
LTSKQAARLRQIGYSLLVLIAFCGPRLSAKSEAAPEIAPMVTLADGSKTQDGAKEQDGKWMLPDGTITYHVKPNGGLDWYTHSGFNRYNDVGGCAACHGPSAHGSNYGPELVNALKTMDYSAFVDMVARGHLRKQAETEFVMPDLGSNKGVMCHIEDIYAYLRARSQGAVSARRPDGRLRDPKPEQAKVFEKKCLE